MPPQGRPGVGVEGDVCPCCSLLEEEQHPWALLPGPDPPQDQGYSVALPHPLNKTLRRPPRPLPCRDLSLKGGLARRPDLPASAGLALQLPGDRGGAASIS